jgi:N-acetylmuramoyl-L-alanine amidase
MARIRDRPSPNFDQRPDGQAVDILLLHYTGMRSAAEALDRLCDPAAKVSAHYCIDEDGIVYRLVDETQRAWHAGLAEWAGASDINARSIGIEIVNPGHEFGYRAFPEPQIQAVTALCREVLARHPIPAARVLGHSDVAPLRKDDPGELFPWDRLAKAGIGLWPDSGAPVTTDPDQAKRDLAAFGYGYLDQDFESVVRAFQRHFRPQGVSGHLDAETMGRLKALVALKTGAD